MFTSQKPKAKLPPSLPRTSVLDIPSYSCNTVIYKRSVLACCTPRHLIRHLP